MKDQMDLPKDGVCEICQQPLASQHWERWLPCGHAVHRSCAARQRRAETLCPCCRMDGKAQVGRRESQLQASTLRLEDCEQVARASEPNRHTDDKCGLRFSCHTVSDEVASGQCGEMRPLRCIRLQSGDPQKVVFVLLMKLVAERLQRPTQAADARDLQVFRKPYRGMKTSQWKCVERALRQAESDNHNGKSSCGSFPELFEASARDHRTKILNYKASNCVNQLQNISAWWSIESRVAKHNEPRAEATRRAGVRRRVPRRARARRRRSRQATAAAERSSNQETEEEEGVSGAAPAEPSPESQDEQSTLDGLPELGSEEVVAHSEAAAIEVENVHISHLDVNQRVEERVEAEQNQIQPDNQDLEEDNTDSDPDYAEPEGFESSPLLDDEESIAPVTISRRIVDIEDSDYDEDTASDASDTTQDNGLHYYAQDEGEQEEDHSEILQTEDTPARTAQGDDAGGATNAFAGSGGRFWTNRQNMWSSLCARVRGYLPLWRRSVQAVRNRNHQVTRPLEDIQLASHGQGEGFRNQNSEEPGTEMEDFSAHTQRHEARRVRRRMTP